MEYNAGKFDVAVIGAGHAGCAACLLYTSYVPNNFDVNNSVDNLKSYLH